ncbi:hypothetical protein [Micromonospora sp. LOL_021]|uniref:hypothetical protein n=1 Tax=Micromonospora sp. LOL_021 TaxID=3345417 RepID=UPI003A89F1E4
MRGEHRYVRCGDLEAAVDRIVGVQYTVENEFGRDTEAVRNLTGRVASPRPATWPGGPRRPSRICGSSWRCTWR